MAATFLARFKNSTRKSLVANSCPPALMNDVTLATRRSAKIAA